MLEYFFDEFINFIVIVKLSRGTSNDTTQCLALMEI